MPEAMAVEAVRLLTPGARAHTDRLRAEHPEEEPGRLGERLAARGVRGSVLDGAFLGGPFMVLWPAAFVAALVAQLRMVLELAALFDPDRDPAALTEDLLVLQGVSPSAGAAREALAAARPAAGEHGVPGEPGEPGERPGWWTVLRRLARLTGLLTAADPTAGRLRRAGIWLGVTAVVLLGFVAPLVWIPASAEMYRRATTRLAARTVAYYAPAGAGARTPGGERRWALRPGALLVALRSVVSVLVIAGVVLTAIAADLRIAASHLIAAAVLLVAVSGLYLLARWRRHRRRR
ncbi:hypothetical protein ACFYNO_00860 [Kitasatospora sp. NPDC006697]|uniref:hypothetical protein n=1 Tax=Kitasatospora sp. NPDC006697 TaxID=3364020 RepID=UPI0036A5EABF